MWTHPPIGPNYMMGQHNRAASGQAYYLVENLDLRGRRKLLDLGGGTASYSIALCSANPQLRAVVVDRGEPLEHCETAGGRTLLTGPDYPSGGRPVRGGSRKRLRCCSHLRGGLSSSRRKIAAVCLRLPTITLLPGGLDYSAGLYARGLQSRTNASWTP